MTDERPTIRPVTLSRLVELTHACESNECTTEDLEGQLDVSHRRARETILEALRIDLLEEDDTGEEATYSTTEIGDSFLDAIRREAWREASEILATRSPHYRAFLDVIDERGAAGLDELLVDLEAECEFTPYSFNQTGIEVVGDWAERLGEVQRHAFSGDYYAVTDEKPPANFHFVLLETYDELEESAGVDLRQRYLSIPRLREAICERTRCTRAGFDAALLAVCKQNVGKLELSGAPMDTAAKDATLGIKQIALSESDGLVTTTQSSQQVMAGVELYEKQYYYLAVHDRDITYSTEVHA